MILPGTGVADSEGLQPAVAHDERKTLMASTIERLRESIDPQTVSNAIYGMMLSWIHSYQHLQANMEEKEKKGKNETRRLSVQVKVYEECLAALLGVDKYDISTFLKEHYGLKEIVKCR